MAETASVFVSSTWIDLREERERVEDAVQRLRETRFVGMEHFGSRAEAASAASLEEVDRSDVLVGIIGHRYGSGITEQEYRRAREKEIPCFIYLAEGVQETKDPELARFVADLRRDHITPSFQGPDHLASLVSADLHRWLFDTFLAAKLNAAVDGAYPRTEAEALIAGISDLEDLPPDLRDRLSGAGIIVAGGDVQIGHRYFSLVSTRTFVVGFALTLAVVAMAGAGYWYFNRPDPRPRLDGTFNIAVADFGEFRNDDGEFAGSAEGARVSRLLHDRIDTEASDTLDIKVSRQNVGLIENAEEAREAAEEMNVNLVIWGWVDGDFARPQMFVSFGDGQATSAADRRELRGGYAAKIRLEEVEGGLDARTAAILQFVEGLTRFTAGDFANAADHFENAADIETSDETVADGKTAALYYMWAGEASREAGELDRAENNIELSLQSDPSYGRAYIAQGNLLMDRAVRIDNNGEFRDDRATTIDRAAEAYEKATLRKNRVPERNVDVRGHLGWGNALFLRAQDSSNDPALMDKALAHYQSALDEVAILEAASLPPERWWDLEYLGHTGQANVHCRRGETALAQPEYQAASASAAGFDEDISRESSEKAQSPCAAPVSRETEVATAIPTMTPGGLGGTATSAPPTPTPVPIVPGPSPTPILPPPPPSTGDPFLTLMPTKEVRFAGERVELCAQVSRPLDLRVQEVLDEDNSRRELIPAISSTFDDETDFRICAEYEVQLPRGARTVMLELAERETPNDWYSCEDRNCSFSYIVEEGETPTATPVIPIGVTPTPTPTPILPEPPAASPTAMVEE